MAKDRKTIIQILSYAAYDWASSPLPTLHASFVFAVYFTTTVMPEGGTTAWAWMTSLSGFAIALAALLSGGLADRLAWRKILLGVLTVIAIVSAMTLWVITPQLSFIPLALCLSALVIFAAELSFVFYNALLTNVTSKDNIGRVSGFSWGLGYIGAIASLALVLFLFIFPETPPFGLDPNQYEHIRIVMPIAGLWLAVFSIPFFIFVPEGKPEPDAGRIKETWALLSQCPGMIRFLISRMFYADGLVTLFAFGGIFAAHVFGLNQKEVLIFAIITNITAGFGAIFGGMIDDRLGAIRTIRVCLIALIMIGGMIMMAEQVKTFWILGSLLGIFIGPLQSASRSHLARIAPQGAEARTFSFMMLTGKSTAFLGPFFYGLVVSLSGDDRWGMAVVLGFLMLGLALLKDHVKA